jgi:hypothetical protein
VRSSGWSATAAYRDRQRRLVTPTSVAVGLDGSLYVSNKGTLVGVGELLRVRPPA